MRGPETRRHSRALMLTVSFCGLVSLAAAAGQEARITVARANVRERPSTSAAIVFQARQGETFPVIESEGDWLLIEGPASRRGYVFGELVEVTGAPVSSAPAAPAVTAPPTSPGVSIQHESVGCVLAGQNPRLDACLSPAESVARAQVHFRAVATDPWYSVELKPDGSCFSTHLPKPTGSIPHFEYYVFSLDREFRQADQPDGAPSKSYRVRVVKDKKDCTSDMGRLAQSVGKAATTVVSVVRDSAGKLLESAAAKGAETGATLTGFSASGVAMASTGAPPAAAATASTSGGSAAGTGGGLSTKAVVIAGAATAGAVGTAVVVTGGEDKPACSAQQLVDQVNAAGVAAGFRYFAADNDTVCVDLKASAFGGVYARCTGVCAGGFCGSGTCSAYYLRSDGARFGAFDFSCITGEVPVSQIQQLISNGSDLLAFCGM